MSKRKRKVRKNKTLNKQPSLEKARNPLFNHPLMKKAHVHNKSYKAKRRSEKVKGAKDWYSQSCFKLKAILRISVLKMA